MTMGFRADLLATGETVVFHTRSHWKKIVLPILIFLIIGGAAAWLVSIVNASWLRWTIIGLAALVLIVASIAPFITWLSSTDTLTTYRLISRSGVIKRNGRDVPLDRVHAVSYERTFLDRLLGCGTLVVQTAGYDSNVLLHDVPRVERRHLQIQELLLGLEIPAEGNARIPRGHEVLPDGEHDLDG